MASNFDIIYRIATDLTGLKTGVDQTTKATEAIDSKMQSLVGSVAKVGAALGLAFSATAVVGAAVRLGKEILADADALTFMSDKTGIGVEALQRFRSIADEAGGSLESITGGVTKFQRGLTEGSASVTAGLNRLGISIADIAKLAPDEQFLLIGRALEGISDPAERSTIAMELFGKAGADNLPALLHASKDLQDGIVVMSKESVAALDRVGDAFSRWFRNAKAGLGEFVAKSLIPTQEGLDKWALILGRAVALPTIKSPFPPPEQLKDITLTALEAEHAERDLTAAAQASIAAHEKAAAAAKTHAEELKKLYTELRAIEFPMRDVIFKLEDLSAVGRKVAIEDAPLLYAKALPQLNLSLVDVGHGAATAATEFGHFGKALKAGVSDTLKSMPGTLAAAFTGGGGIGGAIKSIGSQLGATLGQTIGKTFSTLGSLGGPLGSAIGSLVGPAISALGKLFGFGESAAEKAAKETKKLRDALVEASGGMGALQERAVAAGVTLLAVLNAKTPEAYKKAIDDLNAAFAFQDAAMKTLDETVEKYGFTIEQLGPKFAAQRLDEQAGVLLQDYRVLTAAGVEHVAIIEKMAPSLQEYVTASLKAGVAIPKQFEPILASMVEQGLLTDANGEKLTGLEGLTWSETLTEQFKTVIEKIGLLVDAITRGLNPAILGIPAANVDVNLNAHWNVPDEPQASLGWRGGAVVRSGIQFLGAGGPVGPWVPHGLDTVPAMLSIGEGVLSRDGMAALGALNSGQALGKVVSMDAFLAEQRRTSASIDGLRRDLATTIPTMVGLAARHGGQTRGKGRAR